MLNSLLKGLLQDFPHLRTQMYFKSSLMALSHAMEDLALAGSESPLVIANVQEEQSYRQDVRRYQRIAQHTDHVYVLAKPESEEGLAVDSEAYQSVALNPSDDLTKEWHLVIVGTHYCACLVCREQSTTAAMEPARRYKGFWTFDRQTSTYAARTNCALLSRASDKDIGQSHLTPPKP